MIERTNEEREIWERLFPGNQRQGLVRDFVAAASYLPFVDKIVAQDWEDEDENVRPTIYVIVSEPHLLAGEHALLDTFISVCPTNEQQEILGHVVVVDEKGFLESQERSIAAKYSQVTTLWKSVDFKRQELEEICNYNAHLN